MLKSSTNSRNNECMWKWKSNPYNGVLPYQPDSVCKINWEEFIPVEIRDNLTSEDDVRRLRNYDHEEIILFSSMPLKMIQPTITLMEYAAGCFKHNRLDVLENFLHFLWAVKCEVVPINGVIAIKAADIRSQYEAFKQMDALQIATAVVSGANVFTQMINNFCNIEI